MRFNTYYCAWSIILFLIELYIALHIDDNFIRPYIGDLLVVILIYAIVRAFFKVSIMTAAIGVLLFSFAVEVLQSFKIVEILGLGASQLARTIIGTTFSWEDLVAYSIGIIILLCFEKSIGPYKREWYSIQ
ncbi:DUF2809 domain-containing protein [Acaryochloris sp. 'Moss Beach']|uniref:ribosomal maturation YjgA family protein n=1 Tax=Acaryochloris sp. 'Moss Beach' TaxID=2740837 RepID=UPI001F3F48BB|nr:DUF2809 domain-containing protein [Acaryochloris sp. 'Moss Beach']UJB70640.1 DUF2809 domain-containing protein [Acaryochloris sp. 'Moss Beach']